MYRLTALLLLLGVLVTGVPAHAQSWTNTEDWPPPTVWNGSVNVIQSYTFNSTWGASPNDRVQTTINAQMSTVINIQDSTPVARASFSGSANRDWNWYDPEAGCRGETHRRENGSGTATGPMDLTIGGPVDDVLSLNLGVLPELEGNTTVESQLKSEGNPDYCPQAFEQSSEQVPIDGGAYVSDAVKEMALTFWGSFSEMKVTGVTPPGGPDSPPVFTTSGQASTSKSLSSPDNDIGDTAMGQITTTIKWDLQGMPQKGVLTQEPLGEPRETLPVQSPEKRLVLVEDFSITGIDNPELANTLAANMSDDIASNLRQQLPSSCARVLNEREVRVLLQVDRELNLVGADSAILEQLATIYGTQRTYLVSGQIGRVGDTTTVSLSLLNAQTGNLMARPLVQNEGELSFMTDEMQQLSSEVVAALPACE